MQADLGKRNVRSGMEKLSQKDVKNKDDSLKSRNLRDLIMLFDLVFRDGVWDEGKIYDPVSGNIYSCTIKLKENKLDIRGISEFPCSVELLSGKSEVVVL